MKAMSERIRRAPRQAEAERNDRALLTAAREVFTLDGTHASVAAIAARAGVGIGSLYRRYRTKEELFRHLLSLSLDQWIEAAERGLAHEDPWEGLVHYITTSIELSSGSLGALANTMALTDEMLARSNQSDELTGALVARAHAAGVLRAEVTYIDIALLIEQLGKSPLVEQLTRQGRTDLVDAAANARARIIAIALSGLRPAPERLPGHPPGEELFHERWVQREAPAGDR
ncbi:TetR family transcriptional regulator [Streptomyces sp. CA-256286]|nr:TetR family transcriptional regulator [Streptomyces sp. CA-256286]